MTTFLYFSNIIDAQIKKISRCERNRENLTKLITGAENSYDPDIIENVEKMLREAVIVGCEVEQMKEDGLRMAMNVERQFLERDTAHSERVRTVEIVMAENEKTC